MAKGMYSFIAYSESAKIEEICDVLKGAGAEYAYILHDKDTYDADVTDKDGTKHKAGDLKKPHWHILAGWSKGFKDWKTFKALADSVGAVAVSRKECLVRNPYKAFDYLTHKNTKKSGKAK